MTNPPSAQLPARIRLMGMPVDPVSQSQAIHRILGALAAGRGGWAITPNLDQLRQYHDDARLHPMYEHADLILADGMPLLWASRLQRTPLPERVAGSELIYTLTAAAAAAGRSVFLLGGNEGIAVRAGEELRRRNSALKLAGTHYPPFGFEKKPALFDAMTAALDAARPDIAFVCLGFPKQERLIEQLRQRYPATWFLGVGISLSFVCGDIRRAPTWMQRVGLEWVHRLMQEPGRLFNRYVIHDLPFAAKLFANVIRNRRAAH